MNLLQRCARLLAGGALLLGVALHASAAARHAATLYDEAPKYPANFQHFDYVNPDAPKGGTLRQAGFGGFDSLNPFINKGVAADEINLVYDTLTRRSLDEPFSEYGLLAESIEKAPDNSWVRFTLRRQARFHDGQPVTAADVVFSFDTLMKDGAPQYRVYYADVAKAVAEDERHVRFDFRHGGNRELPLILGQLPVLPKHAWEGREFNRTSLEPPLGSGPYRVAEVQPGRSIRYERVKDWWAKDLPINRGFYNFDTLVIDYYRDNTVALEALKADQFDFWLETSAKNWATAYDTPAVHQGRLIREEIANHNPAGMQGFVFNLRRPLFQDARVREALGLLFDFEWTNRQLFYGAYTRTRSYFENSELAASGLPGADELKLLEPWRERLPAELFERVLRPYKRNLASLGIELQIRRADVSQYINRLRSRDFDLVVGAFSQSNSPGNEQREYWHSSSADNPGSRNLIGLKDPAVDSLVEGLIKADSRQSLLAHTRALDRVLQWGYYVIPNWHIKTWRVARWDRFEHPKVLPLYDIGLYTWWVRPEAAMPPVVASRGE